MQRSIRLHFIAILLISLTVSAQNNTAKKASLAPDGTIMVENIILPEELSNLNPLQQPITELFSFSRPANPQIKNSRGVTLADLDIDGFDEIIFGIDTELYALKGDGSILWQKTVLGPILLPPTVVDMDNDGDMEVIVNTGYPTTVGRIYALDHVGNDLPGWPLNFNDKWMINAPAVSDLDDNGTLDIITCERTGSTEGYVHALNLDGTPINANWPVQFNATPAFTPSIGDIDNDGNKDVVIATSSTGMYAYDSNGTLLTGFPVVDSNVKYSYQSPILVDLDNDDTLEIVGSNHGDAAGFYVMEHDATYRAGWPIATAGWTYSPATVADVDNNGTYELFLADRNTSGNGDPLDVIYGLAPDGSNLPDFPINKYGGNEGVISIADINNDGVMDIIFGSVITDASDVGYLHAYSLDGSGEIAGFPLRPDGFTFLNGAVVGDIDGDGMMDLTVNSYTLTFGTGTDMAFVTSYNLDVPYDASKILRNGYKGSNFRDGLVTEPVAGVNEFNAGIKVTINPNPSDGNLTLSLPLNLNDATLKVYSVDGKEVFSEATNIVENETLQYNLTSLKSGIYFVHISSGNKNYTAKWIRE
ncbi:T9SS type A sorting domain-containing protein [Ulvibacter antarcticus]|uniref:Putative secreted protein (Por secretion system target) n=1 Tax=Ulvibacter antarcticus TaxID=442714 RepID=A0A3L9YBE0_9FLAO|nr:T9SS type A sorting domain-containing protein [Ulvibacter antarcticus]RMA56807.1 putative secreted protein (Por secretion system target) [Ulvibacter antarcticus]